MRGDDELRILILPQGVVHEHEKGELTLWRKSGLGLVEQKEAVAAELVFEEGEEGLAVRTGMQASAAIGFENLWPQFI